MQIQTGPSEPRVVEDFDITSSTGTPSIITVDTQAGDVAKWYSDRLEFKLVEQKSPLDPEVILEAQEILIFFRHTFAIKRRKRTVTDPTPEQKEALQQWIKDMVNSKPSK